MLLLFPGRHHLLTRFQFDYLKELIAAHPVDAILFAVTSANHSNTRRNPLPFHLRAMALEKLGDRLAVPCYVYGIDDIGHVPNFAHYTLKRIKHESEGLFDPTPSNTQVVCSTPVLEMYEQAGFSVFTAELANRNGWQHSTPLPWDVVEMIARDPQWHENDTILTMMDIASAAVWKKYRLGPKVQTLFRDSMISEDGDITTSRDYNSYVRQMDDIAQLKYQETSAFIQPGRIGDIGCAVGSWIKLACADVRFRESDFYGIEVARHLFDVCQQRKHNGEFANPFVFFSQRNAVTGLVFDRDSMNTIHTSSLTHEIESYGSRADLLAFIQNRYDELAPGGVWINRDVVGPNQKEQMVHMMLAETDGRNENTDAEFPTREELATYLRGLSTRARFHRFVRDFRRQEGYTLRYEEVKHGADTYFRLSLRDACEFMSRKDYVDNWQSEMHETFCFWDFDEWKNTLEEVGFTVTPQSYAYTNTWIVKNRLEGKVVLCNEHFEPMAWPVTGMIMVARKV